MGRVQVPVEALADRFSRPQRIGIFGYRGVGKTTMVTVLYREAVGGRLPGLRLAAADARTANYLSDKILQLESGQPLPGTLAETDLRFHLYHNNSRIELLLRDYQGEHIELGREEPIGEFLRDCDGLWLCFDAHTLHAPAERLRRQQEVEQLLEAYLAAESQRKLDRPAALVLTKGDLLGETVDQDELAATHFGMTRYTLQSHCPNSSVFVVSSLGGSDLAGGKLEPKGLATPLAWLAGALQTLDQSRLERLWALAPRNLDLLGRCITCFARRYPDAPATAAHRQRLAEARRRRFRHRLIASAAAAACLITGLWTYDTLGYQQALRFQEQHASDPGASRSQWQDYRAWHPTRNLLHPGAAEAERDRLAELDLQVRRQRCEEVLTDLRQRAADPNVDPETLWQQFRKFRVEYPEAEISDDLARISAGVEKRRDNQLARREQRAYDELVAAEQQTADLAEQVKLTERFLAEHGEAAQASAVRHRRDEYLLRIEEHAIETARNYSARSPLNFQTRREHYQRYLDRHSNGAFASEARTALRNIEGDWDRHDFRAVRDHFLAKPGDTTELIARCRTYLAVHPRGQFVDNARELLRWSEHVTAPHEYRVILVEGKFDKSIAHFFSRGPKLSVELEVNGIRYGPSQIIYNRYDPDWDYEFPRPIRWKLGDKVQVRVTEHSWKDGVVADKEADDPLSLQLLCDDVLLGKHRLTFKCPDFRLPRLPEIE